MRAPESAHPGSVYQTPINLTSRWSCAINLSSDLAELFEAQHSAKQRRNKIVIRNPAREDWVSRIQMVTGLVPSRMNEAPDIKKQKKKGTKKRKKERKRRTWVEGKWEENLENRWQRSSGWYHPLLGIMIALTLVASSRM